MRAGEAAVDLRFLGVFGGEEGVELLARLHVAGVCVAGFQRAGVKGVLDRLQNVHDPARHLRRREKFLLLVRAVAAGERDAPLLQIARADFDPHGDPFLDPLPVLDAAAEVALVHLHDDRLAVKRLRAQFLRQLFSGGEDGLARLGLRRDGEDHHVRGGDARREDHPVVVGVRHDERANEPGAHAPACRPGELLAPLARLEADAARLGKVLPEEVRGSRLDRLAVLHHRLDAKRPDGSRKPLALALLPAVDGDGEVLAGEGCIHAEHFLGFLDRLLFRLVRGVPLLPEKLGGAQEKAGAHLPADDVGPLVDEDRQVAVRLDPLGVGRPDDRLRGGADDERLGELRGGRGAHPAICADLQAVMRDHGALLGEPFHVRRLFFQVADRDEEREIGVPVPRCLEERVELPLDRFPEAVAPRLDDHAAAHVGVLGQVRRADDLLVPFGEVFVAAGRDRVFRRWGRR